jgi:hypothetical protein
VERREQVTRVETVRVNGQPEELAGFGGRRQPLLGVTSRMSREAHVRICERLCQEDAKAFCCTKDEGGPFGAALQGEASNCHELLWSKAMVMNVMVKRRGM